MGVILQDYFIRLLCIVLKKNIVINSIPSVPENVQLQIKLFNDYSLLLGIKIVYCVIDTFILFSDFKTDSK